MDVYTTDATRTGVNPYSFIPIGDVVI